MTEAGPQERRRSVAVDVGGVLVGGGAPVVEAYLAAGATECIPIYNALDPHLHFPVSPEKRFEADLGLLNDHAPEREARNCVACHTNGAGTRIFAPMYDGLEGRYNPPYATWNASQRRPTPVTEATA